MRSIEFDKVNAIIGKDTLEPINAFINDDENSINCCFHFSEVEMKEIIKTGKIWYKQYLYDKDGKMQPIKLSVNRDDIIDNPAIPT